MCRPGRVLLNPAEDALHVVRRRLEGICAAAGIGLAGLDVQVITAPSLRLDLEADRGRLDETVARLKPRLLVLDPFVRLHRIDENVSGDVAPLLAFPRELQRRHAVAVAVVHHARKGAGAIRAGQALRGSSEFHAWGNSNLYRLCFPLCGVREMLHVRLRDGIRKDGKISVVGARTAAESHVWRARRPWLDRLVGQRG